jgi:hypothetical protein
MYAAPPTGRPIRSARRRRAVLGHQGAIEGVVLIAEERRRPAIATPGEMVWDAGNHETGHAGHTQSA